MSDTEQVGNSLLQVAYVNDDATEVVLNYGRSKGLRQGLKILIYRLGPEIIDPESKKPLGQLELVLGSGIITHVQDNIATVKSNSIEKMPDRRKIYDDKEINRLSSLGGMFGKNMREEIIHGDTIIAPFKAPKIGDYAKIIG